MRNVIVIMIGIVFSINVSAQSSGGQIKRSKPRTSVKSVHNKKNNNVNLYSNTGVHNGYGYVDMGLSVKWATCNVEATSPEIYGSYFAWGETSSRTDFGSTPQTSIRDDVGTNISGTLYDAARFNLGGKWRLPTKSEFEELINKCKWKRSQYKGVNGFCVTGPNGRSIFIPAAGYRPGEKLESGFFIKLWTGTAELDSKYNLCRIYHLHLDNNIYQTPPVQVHLIREALYAGMCIRPVVD